MAMRIKSQYDLSYNSYKVVVDSTITIDSFK